MKLLNLTSQKRMELRAAIADRTAEKERGQGKTSSLLNNNDSVHERI